MGVLADSTTGCKQSQHAPMRYEAGRDLRPVRRVYTKQRFVNEIVTATD
jgi:hypothetical protein